MNTEKNLKFSVNWRKVSSFKSQKISEGSWSQKRIPVGTRDERISQRLPIKMNDRGKECCIHTSTYTYIEVHPHFRLVPCIRNRRVRIPRLQPTQTFWPCIHIFGFMIACVWKIKAIFRLISSRTLESTERKIETRWIHVTIRRKPTQRQETSLFRRFNLPWKMETKLWCVIRPQPNPWRTAIFLGDFCLLHDFRFYHPGCQRKLLGFDIFIALLVDHEYSG